MEQRYKICSSLKTLTSTSGWVHQQSFSYKIIMFVIQYSNLTKYYRFNKTFKFFAK